MFMIAGIGRNSDYSSNGKIQSRNPKPVYVYVELDAPLAHDGQFRRKYKPGQYLYFNCYIDLTGQGDYDYIKGYGEITDAGYAQTTITVGSNSRIGAMVIGKH